MSNTIALTRQPVHHEAAAHLSISKTGRLYLPTIRGVVDDLRVDRHRTPRPLRGLVSALEALGGFRVVRRDGLELLEHLLRRGLVAGGTDMADYLEGEIVDHIFRNTAIFAAPANVYVALYTADPGETGAGTEVANANGYAREAVNTSTGWSGSAGSGATDNVAAVDFGSASGGNWGTITHVAITDSATHGGGNHLLNDALTASKTVNDGDSFQFPAGDLDISFD